jgi:hypothetical protein
LGNCLFDGYVMRSKEVLSFSIHPLTGEWAASESVSQEAHPQMLHSFPRIAEADRASPPKDVLSFARVRTGWRALAWLERAREQHSKSAGSIRLIESPMIVFAEFSDARPIGPTNNEKVSYRSGSPATIDGMETGYFARLQ